MWAASMPAAASSSAGVPEPGHRAHRELGDDRVRLLGGERVEHRVADAALRPVVLDGDDRPGLATGGSDRLGVDRLDAVQVDHPAR